MNTKTMLAALALATVVAVPATAQRTTTYQTQRTYDRTGFWNGAPDGLQQRIDWLQQRVDRGARDGSLDRREYARAQRELNYLRQQAAELTQRLDSLSQNIRWARNSGYGNGYNTGYNNGYVDPNQFTTTYDASRYYRDDPRYQERVLTTNDQVYRGSDGRYYCQRSDGTTGLIVGGAGGALLGNVIDGGSNRIAGTLIGGALGALLGRTVDQNNSEVRCR